MQQQKKSEKGEGDREAARRYDAGVRANAGASEKQARQAAEALDGPEGEELEKAARVGKEAARHERR